MKMKRFLAAVLALTMIFASLTGCGKKEDEVVEITWMFWDDLNATEDLISIGYKDVVERFNKDYEGAAVRNKFLYSHPESVK